MHTIIHINTEQEMNPLITVVTVVKNDEKNIEKTLLSVLSQDYPLLEYIIIDGGSTDQTLSIVKKYSDKITSIISEPDLNIFDAMNKGILHATGEWINFMNSGDRFVNNSILTEIFSFNRENADLIYGNSIIEFDNGKTRYLKVQNNREFWKRYINHQSILTQTHLLKDNPFIIKYDLCSDFDFLINMHQQNKRFCYLAFPVSVRSSGGRSDLNRIKSHIQKGVILKNRNISNIKQYKIYSYIFFQIILESMKGIAKPLYIRMLTEPRH